MEPAGSDAIADVLRVVASDFKVAASVCLARAA
jgi:hypothetical protein